MNTGDIAIIGLDISMPGCRDQDEVWNFLSHKRVSKGKFPARRLNQIGLPDDENRYMEGSFFEAIDEFDHRFYHISQKSADYMDPNQRLTLLSATRALHDSGYLDRIRGAKASVYASVNTTQQYQYQLQLQQLGLKPDLLGMLNSTISSRINYLYDLRGPAVMTDTACSSSLVSIIQACNDLSRGDADYAVVVSTNLYIKPGDKADKLVDILAADATTKAFDERSTGTSIGEGVGAVILKRREDAERDGDSIYGLIKGYAVNNDGQTVNMSSPNPLAQENLIEAAWTPLADQLDRLAFIEAHGTGTAVGDSIEFESLTPFFLNRGLNKQSVALTACKSNFGHLDVASGLFSLIKSVLSLKHKILLPHPDFRIPNGEIEFEHSVFYIPDKCRTLESRALAGISSFGMTGTNAHVILEAYEGNVVRQDKELELHLRPYWFPLERNSFAVNQELQRVETERMLIVQFPQSLQKCWEIREHKFGGKHLLVGTSAFEIIAQGLCSTPYDLERYNIQNLHIQIPLMVQKEDLDFSIVLALDKETLKATISFTKQGVARNWLQFELLLKEARQWPRADLFNDPGLQEVHVTSQVGEGEEGGVAVSGRWEVVDKLWINEDNTRAVVKLKAPLGYEREFGLYSFYPALLDPAFNALNRSAEPDDILFPWHWGQIEFRSSKLTGRNFYSEIHIREKTSDNIGNIIVSLDVWLYDSEGNSVLAASNYKVKNAVVGSGETRGDYFKQEQYIAAAFNEWETGERSLTVMHESLRGLMQPKEPVLYFGDVSELLKLLPSMVEAERLYFWDKSYRDEAGVAGDTYELGQWLVGLNRETALKQFHYINTELFGYAGMNALNRSVGMGLYSLRLELNFKIKVVDTSYEREAAGLSRYCFKDEDFIIHRNQQFHIIRFTGLKPEVKEAGKLDGRIVLVIGGSSGIGRQYAKYLAAQYTQAKVIVAGRKAEWEGEPLQGNICYRTLDITNEEQVEQFAAAEGRFVDYVLNFAGEPAKGLFANKTKDDFCARTRSKINGSFHMGKWFSHVQEIIHFSSLAGLIGAMGQTEYCAANAYQSGLAQTGSNIRTLNLTGWADVGMSAGKKDFYFEKLHSSDGVKLIDLFVHSGIQQASMFKLKTAAEEYSSLFGRAATVRNTPIANLTAAATGSVNETVMEAWKRTLGEDHYDPALSFFEQGGDSITIVHLCEELNRSFPGSFDVTTLFSIPTIDGQAEWIERAKEPLKQQDVPLITIDAAEMLNFLYK
ncbi:SDR family NAD(P)-dependent oxidoreductase [Paenibacillus sp. 19GGS1-52]|uniref:SDR family NAD(P)-dependent oxidoreductase n=1 Tax=Paenibacillus sp. 19GGS1-52 TaxID=2758563 RepID=UPI001EFB18F5|nr:SDR family NAD(P)-dependent oxidoreductase [Paenibacillus sp. 19GGS1-52]ULO08714.1 SDR family NAD(P)-dependent oxidoreductase [Paenibacillus sp. 19GGS1-52]